MARAVARLASDSAVAGLLAHAHIGDVTAAGQSSFLPPMRNRPGPLDALQQPPGGSEDVPVVIVFERRGGLTGKTSTRSGGSATGSENWA